MQKVVSQRFCVSQPSLVINGRNSVCLSLILLSGHGHDFSRVRNKRIPTFINFCNFFRGYGLITDLKDLNFTKYISFHILRGYVYSFCQILQRLRLFKGLRLWSIIGQEDVQQFAKNLDLQEVLTIQRFTIQVFREL